MNNNSYSTRNNYAEFADNDKIIEEEGKINIADKLISNEGVKNKSNRRRQRKKNTKQNIEGLSVETKRAVSSAHFVANIINNYQNDNKCPFIKDDKDHINLLKYVYIRGGSLRDIVLKRNINDIDLVVNITKLTTIYLQHLKQYHSEKEQQSIKCGCYLWQRYLNIYRNNTVLYENNEIDPIKRLEINMVRCNFLLNGNFIKDLIVNCDRSSIIAINTWGYTNWVIKIIKSLIYGNDIDLNGARFDIGDEMSDFVGMNDKNIVNKNQSIFNNTKMDYFYMNNNKNNNNALYKNYDIINNNKKNELISIHLPIYKFTMNYSTQFCDFAINGLRIPLSSIYNENNNVSFNWYSKISNYTNSINNNGADDDDVIYKKHNKLAMKTIKNKIIKQPDLGILSMEHIYNDYFWRFIKILCKMHDNILIHNEWKIDEKTLNLIKKSWNIHWKKVDNIKMKEFINRLTLWAIDIDNIDCGEYKIIVKKRINIFKYIGFDICLKDVFKRYPSFINDIQIEINYQLSLKSKKIDNNFFYKLLNVKNNINSTRPIIEGNETKITKKSTPNAMMNNYNSNTEKRNKYNYNSNVTATNDEYKYSGKDFLKFFKGSKNRSKPIYTSTPLFCTETCRNNKNDLINYLINYGKFNKDNIIDINFIEGKTIWRKNRGDYSYRGVTYYYSIIKISGNTDNISNKIGNMNLGKKRILRKMESKPAKYWHGKENKILFVTNFDIINEKSHHEFTKLFMKFGNLACDPILGKDKKFGDPFGIVEYQNIEDAMECCKQHNTTNKYLCFTNKVLKIDYSLKQQ